MGYYAKMTPLILCTLVYTIITFGVWYSFSKHAHNSVWKPENATVTEFNSSKYMCTMPRYHFKYQCYDVYIEFDNDAEIKLKVDQSQYDEMADKYFPGAVVRIYYNIKDPKKISLEKPSLWGILTASIVITIMASLVVIASWCHFTRNCFEKKRQFI